MKQFFRFLTVGVVNTLLGYCLIFACMYEAKLSPEASNVIGYAVGFVISYGLNRKYTFQSSQKRRGEIVRFLVVFVLAYAANFAMLVVLIRMNIHKGISQVVAGLVYAVLSFVMNKYYAFATSRHPGQPQGLDRRAESTHGTRPAYSSAADPVNEE
jgi:putative flippase GtrA